MEKREFEKLIDDLIISAMNCDLAKTNYEDKCMDYNLSIERFKDKSKDVDDSILECMDIQHKISYAIKIVELFDSNKI